VTGKFPVVFLAYAAAALLHHAHNAEHLAQYPGMPAWLTRTGVYLLWLGATAVGVLGYWLRNRVLLAVYGLYGVGVLAHYAVAPLSAHTPAMHLTIGLEAAAGTALLAAVFFSPDRPSP
jgi:hypothetical protein